MNQAPSCSLVRRVVVVVAVGFTFTHNFVVVGAAVAEGDISVMIVAFGLL